MTDYTFAERENARCEMRDMKLQDLKMQDIKVLDL